MPRPKKPPTKPLNLFVEVNKVDHYLAYALHNDPKEKSYYRNHKTLTVSGITSDTSDLPKTKVSLSLFKGDEFIKTEEDLHKAVENRLTWLPYNLDFKEREKQRKLFKEQMKPTCVGYLSRHGETLSGGAHIDTELWELFNQLALSGKSFFLDVGGHKEHRQRNILLTRIAFTTTREE
jgi:hypothetical protein